MRAQHHQQKDHQAQEPLSFFFEEAQAQAQEQAQMEEKQLNLSNEKKLDVNHTFS
jgi:uncharacterized protein YfcZ (UPF0381/DUF406 family)